MEGGKKTDLLSVFCIKALKVFPSPQPQLLLVLIEGGGETRNVLALW